MLELYTWPRSFCYAVTVLLALTVLVQALTTLVSFYRHPRNLPKSAQTIEELVILGHVFICSLLHGQAMQAYQMGILVPTGYELARSFSFVLIALAAVAVAATRKTPRPLLIVAGAALTLPATEQFVGHLFAFCYVAAVLTFFVRGIAVGWQRFRELRSSLSMLTIKNATDSLNAGVLFCEEDGFILLSNRSMQQLMRALTGSVQRNGKAFLALIRSGEIKPTGKIARYEEHQVCLLPEGSAWMFALSELRIGRKNYLQLTASDISERWKLTEALEASQAALLQSREELDETIANLQTISREQEMQKARMRAHDILGSRLSRLLRAAESEEVPDYELLRSLSQGLIDELKAAEHQPSAEEALETLAASFARVGVQIHLEGELPQDPASCQLLIEIAREATTNAVRHAFATQVFIYLESIDNDFRLVITDNGRLSTDTITEGGGISGMRERVRSFGGSVFIKATEGFALTVVLPGGGVCSGEGTHR